MPTLMPISLTVSSDDTLWNNDVHLFKRNLTEVMDFTPPAYKRYQQSSTVLQLAGSM